MDEQDRTIERLLLAGVAAADLVAGNFDARHANRQTRADQVKKTEPSWPRSWANFSLF